MENKIAKIMEEFKVCAKNGEYSTEEICMAVKIFSRLKKIIRQSNKIDSKTEKVLSNALKAFCLTYDYVGTYLRPLPGWEWHDSCKEISEIIPNNKWKEEFEQRCNDFLTKR